MGGCTGIRCPAQVGYDVANCNQINCIYRTEVMTNYDRIKSMSVEEMALAMTNLKTIIIAEIISHLGIVPRNIEHKPEKDLALYTQWLLQEVSEDDR